MPIDVILCLAELTSVSRVVGRLPRVLVIDVGNPHRLKIKQQHRRVANILASSFAYRYGMTAHP